MMDIREYNELQWKINFGIKILYKCTEALEKDKDMLNKLYNDTVKNETEIEVKTGLKLCIGSDLMDRLVNSYLNKNCQYSYLFFSFLEFYDTKDKEIKKEIESIVDDLRFIYDDIDKLIEALKEATSKLQNIRKKFIGKCKREGYDYVG